MRNIKFRAKETQNADKQFVYGTLIDFPDGKPYIGIMRRSYDGCMIWEYIEVIEDTIGQFTGLHDCNGKEIYEGDVITIQKISVKFIVTWNDELGGFFLSDGCRPLGTWLQEENMEVIGNIHDNPELIKEVKL